MRRPFWECGPRSLSGSKPGHSEWKESAASCWDTCTVSQVRQDGVWLKVFIFPTLTHGKCALLLLYDFFFH